MNIWLLVFELFELIKGVRGVVKGTSLPWIITSMLPLGHMIDKLGMIFEDGGIKDIDIRLLEGP